MPAASVKYLMSVTEIPKQEGPVYDIHFVASAPSVCMILEDASFVIGAVHISRDTLWEGGGVSDFITELPRAMGGSNKTKNQPILKLPP